MKPLFVPLLRRYFDAFATGAQTEEWRRYGPRWNETTCRVGRDVTLALGYTRTRLTGRVVSFARKPATGGARDIYGADAECAVIGIKLGASQ